MPRFQAMVKFSQGSSTGIVEPAAQVQRLDHEELRHPVEGDDQQRDEKGAAEISGRHGRAP